MNEKKNFQKQNSFSFLNDLKDPLLYSKESKLYNKLLKTRKLEALLKRLSPHKSTYYIDEFGFDLSLRDKKPFIKKKVIFDKNKFKEYLLKLNKKEEEKKNFKKLLFKSKKHSVLQKIKDITIQNIEYRKKIDLNRSLFKGEYKPNFDSIDKKNKIVIIRNNKNNYSFSIHRKSLSKINYSFKDNEEISIKDSSLSLIKDNKVKMSIFDDIDFSSETSRKNDNELSSIQMKNEIKENLETNNDKQSSINIKLNRNSINRKETNKISKKNMKKLTKTLSQDNVIIDKQNKDRNICLNNNLMKKSNKTNKQLSKINKIRILTALKIQKNKELQKKNEIKDNILIKENKNFSLSEKRNNRKNLFFNKSIRNTKIRESLFINGKSPPTGYYHPNYDFVLDNHPSINFSYIKPKKNDLSFKKNLLRKAITKYGINKEYQVINSLNKT